MVAIVGSTAAGKSALAIEVARRCDGEVVNTDAMQLYRGMDIGTGKVEPSSRRGVPHHLLDVLDVREAASVAQFQRWARACVTDVVERGRLPVLVGGSALYTRAVIDRFEFPGTDPQLRQRLEDDLRRDGPEALHARLAGADPVAAAAIASSNTRRVVRALEVVTLTGRPFLATLPPPTYWRDDTVQIGVDVPRPLLDERIAARVEQMWRDGLVPEVRRLEAAGLREGRTASRALGYQQVLACLAGECGEDEAKDATVRATRRFARRQESWFRRDERVQWLRHDRPDLVEAAVALTGCLRSPRG